MLKKILENKKLRSDIILIAAALFVGLVALLVAFLLREDGSRVVVSVDGKKVAEYSLNVDGTYYLNDGTNVLVIEDGYAYMKEANCPGFQDCVEKGKISYVGQSITCLPNKVIVEIVGEGEEILS
ncbi:MAG: NusG domain II-containing protein [Clostridia bacterium]|nr:NusG domain II-containing protein [Clostridia bacterium]